MADVKELTPEWFSNEHFLKRRMAERGDQSGGMAIRSRDSEVHLTDFIEQAFGPNARFGAAQQIDKRTCDAIMSLAPEKIEKNGACGRFPVGGLLQLAKARGMKVETIDLKNSGDTAGTKDRVVGYGAWAFYDPTTRRKTVPLNITINKKQPDNAPDSPTDFEKQTKQLLAMHGPHLLDLADTSIRHALEHGKPMSLNLSQEPEALRADGAAESRCAVVASTCESSMRGQTRPCSSCSSIARISSRESLPVPPVAVTASVETR